MTPAGRASVDCEPRQQDSLDQFGVLAMETIEMLPTPDKFKKLCQAADDGDVTAQSELSSILAQAMEIVASMSDFVEIAKRVVIEDAGGDSFTAKQAIR